jgi:hypothetical protein
MKCGHCSKTEQVDVVCHHCGTPLCPKHRVELLNDPVFVDPTPLSVALSSWARRLWRKEPPPLPMMTIHCPTCAKTYHSQTQPVKA